MVQRPSVVVQRASPPKSRAPPRRLVRPGGSGWSLTSLRRSFFLHGSGEASLAKGIASTKCVRAESAAGAMKYAWPRPCLLLLQQFGSRPHWHRDRALRSGNHGM